MNIVVCIKQVPDTTEIKIDPVKNTLIRTGVPSIMNPFDKNGLSGNGPRIRRIRYLRYQLHLIPGNQETGRLRCHPGRQAGNRRRYRPDRTEYRRASGRNSSDLRSELKG